VRIPQETKAELEAMAAAENVDLATFVRRHFNELLMESKISVDAGGGTLQVPNPYGQQPFPYVPSVPNQPSYPGYYPRGGYGFRPPDAIDTMVNDMRKLVMVKLMKELLQGNQSMTPEQFLLAAQGKKNGDDGFSWDKYMRFQMMTQQQDRAMMQAQQQLENARQRGDKGGENQAIQLMTALMANQSAQQQQFMQNFMAVQQTNQSAQTTLFNTALSTGQQRTADENQQRREYDQRMELLRTQMNTQNMTMVQAMNQQHVSHLTLEMERIRQEKPKDTIEQIAKLMELRKTSPVYKAAFDIAFGVTEESTIGKLIPQLKALGVDKLIEKVAATLGAAIMKPKVPTPSAIPAPTPITLPPGQTRLPGLPPTPTGPQQPAQRLEDLTLPGTQKTPQTREYTPTPTPPETATQPQTTKPSVLPESAIGYTNIDREKQEKKAPSPPRKTETQ